MKIRYALFVSLLLLFTLSFLYGCNNPTGGGSPTKPFFTDPSVKITQLSSPEFTEKLIKEAKALDPDLIRSGNHIYMGYYSRWPNGVYLKNLLGAINASTLESYRAIWDEGVTTYEASRFPAYIRMNDEFWYERAYPVSGEVIITIEGVTRSYTDPHPVTTFEADIIWGKYSQRYAYMASAIRQGTGITPEALCFVKNAYSNRIFYSYELPVLISLEALGDVRVFFALTTEADWTDPSNWTSPSYWIEGTVNAPTPEAP